MNVPEELLKNPHFARYYRTWQKNEASIVFVPLAQFCREQGLFHEAREICERGLQKHPDSVSGRLMLARIFFDQDDPSQSHRIVERVLEEFPGQQEAMALLARIRHTQVKEVHEDKKVTSSPLWENVTMAKIYASQGETKIAHQMLDRILSRRPDDEKAKALKEELAQ